MAKKIICESYGTIFPFDRVKDMDESEEELMYFDQIMIFQEDPEHNNVRVYCGKCGESNMQDINMFDKLIDREYVILKKDVILKCRGCGKEHKPRKIRYKLKDHYVSVLKHCPVCNSVMVKKNKNKFQILGGGSPWRICNAL